MKRVAGRNCWTFILRKGEREVFFCKRKEELKKFRAKKLKGIENLALENKIRPIFANHYSMKEQEGRITKNFLSIPSFLFLSLLFPLQSSVLFAFHHKLNPFHSALNGSSFSGLVILSEILSKFSPFKKVFEIKPPFLTKFYPTFFSEREKRERESQ